MIMPLSMPAQNGYAFAEQVMERVAASPAIASVALMSYPTLGALNFRFNRENNPLPDGNVMVAYSAVSPAYLRTLKTPRLAGRDLDDRDLPNTVQVALINETMAREYFPDENPIGRTLLLPNGPDPARAILVPIVGIVADLRTADLETPIEPQLFIDYRHGNPFAMTVNVRTTGDPLEVARAVRARLAAIDTTQALFEMKRLDTALIDSIAPRRMTLALVGIFAGSALLLGVIGVYGVMAYSVAQRTQEIGVRMALGATPGNVLKMVITQGIRLTAAGVALGAISAVATSRVLTSLLYGIEPTDAGSFAVACAGVAATAIAACSVPAIAASLVDPVVALRCE